MSPDANLNSKQLKRHARRLKQQRLDHRHKLVRLAKRTLTGTLVMSGLFGFIWYLTNQPSGGGRKVIARAGLHWHPELDIYLNNLRQAIPANIGISGAHNPIHTHAADNVIHLEMSGLVYADDIRLGEFFKVWGQTLTPTCIFKQCNDSAGTLKMFVNGQPSTEFDQYQMHDKDKIELRYD
ncbi:MAG: hypothetical protein HY974_00670 [Candidatus Kerfeldbacteria bacterium]|nr:hypothetical protein [Candidatus Kerfeldbacteria bacterium]